jgi:hypothetical protein
MMTTATKRRGMLAKRLRATQTFRSVLSMDVEHRGYMPNLKISSRNTLQVTGAQDLEVLGDILHYLVNRYRGCGFVVRDGVERPGFVGDVVLANVHFKLNFRLDRTRLRDRINAERGAFIAAYEPLMRDVSVSLKYANTQPLPYNGAVRTRRWNASAFPRVRPSTLGFGGQPVEHGDAARGAAVGSPHQPEARGPPNNVIAGVSVHPVGCRCGAIRSRSGSVIVVSRWPVEMCAVYAQFCQCMHRLRRSVIDPDFARQRTITGCWCR